MTALPSLSILIPTYNRARALRAVLPSYLEQGNVRELIIVDDGSADNTAEVVREFQRNSRVRIFFLQNKGRMGQQASRHVAIDASTSEWVMFGEDDVWLAEDYCRNLVAEAGRVGADILAGRLVTALVGEDFSHLDLDPHVNDRRGPVCDMRNFVADFDACPIGTVPVPFVHTIALIRREIFGGIGFDEWYKGGAQREETDFYLTAVERGYKVCFTPKTTCYHLRGPICSSGGQRINRLLVEYYFAINTFHMVSKHWGLLEKEYGFKGGALAWTLMYLVRRLVAQLARIIRGDFVSTFKQKS